jgi:glycosyltransferase involved in cell wall biosynthesis
MLGGYPGWVPNPAEYLAPRLFEKGYSCSLVSSKRSRYRRLLDILFTILNNRSQIDTVCLQVYGGPSFIVEDTASFLAYILGIPLVMILHGGDLPIFMGRFPNWSKRVLERANVIVAPSAFLAESVRRSGFDAVVIPNAIEVEKYPFLQRSQVQPNLLWMRTFHDVYNPQMAVEVFAKVKETYPHAKLTMGGQEKGLLEVTRQLANKLGVSDSVRFIGFLGLEDKQREFVRHDIFLNTNRVDNMPVSVLEAAAFGIPIVATAVGGVPYLLQDGETGLLVQTEDADGMSRAVIRVLEEPGLAERLSKNARTLAEMHDWSVVLPMWENLFQKVMT